MDDVISIVRSCLLTSKFGMTLDQLNREYRSIDGSAIPYRQFHFTNLNDFLKSVPGLSITSRNGITHIEAIPTSATAHIADLVSRQRAPKKKRKPMDRYVQTYRKPNVQQRSNCNRQSSYRSRPGVSSGSSYQFNDRSSQNYVRISQQSSQQTIRSNNVPQKRPPPLMAQPVTKTPQSGPPRPVSAPINRNTSQPSPPKSSPPTLSRTNSQPVNRYPSQSTSNCNTSRPTVAYNHTNIIPSSVTTGTNGKSSQPPISTPITNLQQAPTQVRPKLSERLTANQTPSIRPEEINTTKNIASDVSKPLTPMNPQSSDPREELKKLVQQLNLDSPEYKITRTTKKGGRSCEIYCQVILGRKYKVSSYPEEAKTEEDAEKLAAAQVIECIRKSCDSLVQLKVTSDKQLIKERIVAIVDVHNGVVENQLPTYYQEKYNENLPENWASIVEEYPMELRFEKNATGDSSILWRYNSAIHQTKKPLSPPVDNVMSFIGDPEPPAIEFPTDETWPVYVTNVVSTTEVWVNIIGANYSDRHHAMHLKMSQTYSSSMQSTKTVVVGRYYIVKDDEGWQRVRVETLDCSENTAEVFFIDTGHFEEVSSQLLYNMEKQFYDLAPQAIRLNLADLEDLADCNTVTDIAVNLLLHNHRYVKLVTRQMKNDDDDFTASAVFYDTTGDDDIDINDLIYQKMLTFFEASKLKIENKVLHVYMSHVGLNGDIYVQMANEGPQIISSMVNRVTSCNEFNTAAVDDVIMTGMYLVECPDNTWLRAKPIIKLGNTTYKMLLVDVGGHIIVEITKLRKLDRLPRFVKEFPEQAFCIKLQNIDDTTFDEAKVNELIDLAPRNQELICKIIFNSPDLVVQLFNRNRDHKLISINATLEDLGVSKEDGNNNLMQARTKRLDRTNSRASTVGEYSQEQKGLRAPTIPAVNEFFEIKVTNLVASPDIFFVQPRNECNALNKMMEYLQTFYESYRGPKLTPQSLRREKLCVAKYNNKWYRAFIREIIENENVVVYLCDFGNITPVPIDDLRPLMKEKVLDLSYQAIKARLHGIEAINVDWSPLTCKRFYDLVAGRDFVASVKLIENDNTTPTGQIVSLELYDTSTESDIRIDEILVNERRAKFIK